MFAMFHFYLSINRIRVLKFTTHWTCASDFSQRFLLVCRRAHALCYKMEHFQCQARCLPLRLEELEIPRIISKTVNIFLPPPPFRYWRWYGRLPMSASGSRPRACIRSGARAGLISPSAHWLRLRRSTFNVSIWLTLPVQAFLRDGSRGTWVIHMSWIFLYLSYYTFCSFCLVVFQTFQTFHFLIWIVSGILCQKYFFDDST